MIKQVFVMNVRKQGVVIFVINSALSDVVVNVIKIIVNVAVVKMAYTVPSVKIFVLFTVLTLLPLAVQKMDLALAGVSQDGKEKNVMNNVPMNVPAIKFALLYSRVYVLPV